MFSKKLTTLVLSLSVVTGCSLPIYEEPPKQKPPSTGFEAGSQCLTNLLPVMERFVDGTANPAEVGATWDCLASALTTFEDSTRGRYEDRFMVAELANFVERYFMDNQKITPALRTEIFRLKQLFVGGAIDYITRKEMHTLINTASELKRISLGLLPYMKVLSMNWGIGGYRTLDEDVKYFESANLQIQIAAKELATIIEKNGQGYNLENVVVLLNEISSISDEPFKWLDDLKDVMPIVYKIKETLSGGDPRIIQPSEWRRFSLLGARAYVQYLRYFYFIKQVDNVGSGPELVYIARSIDDLFSYLGDMVAGKPEGVLTRTEVKEILEALAQFFPDIHVNDRFLLEVMKIKQLIFGGSLDNFTPADFERARTKVESFRALTEKLFSYVAVYGLSWNPKEMSYEDGQDYFTASDKNLAEFAQVLGTLAETNYDLNDLYVLADEADKFYPPATANGTFKELADQVVPIAISAKNIIFTDQSPVVTRNQWSDFLHIASGFYGKFMYYYYFLKGTSVTGGEGLVSLNTLVNQTADFLDSLIARKPGSPTKAITYDELDRLVDAAHQGKLLPEKVTAKTLKNLVRVVIQKMLIAPEKRLRGDPILGLTTEVTSVVRKEFSIWLSNQKFLDHIYSNVPQDRGLTGTQILNEIAKAEQTEGIKELKMFFNSPFPLSHDGLDRLYLSYNWTDYSRKSVAMANLSRLIVRLVLRSYAMDLVRVYSYEGITLVEANQLFTDVKPFVVEFGLLDPRNNTFADSRFREANLFVPRANGSDFLDFREGMDLFTFLFSGVTVDGLISPIIKKSCPVDETPTLKDDWTVQVSCLVPVYRKEISQAFASMPDMVKFFNGLSPQKFQEVFTNLLKAAGYIPDNTGKARLGDVALVPHVTQYVEAVIQKFDKNKDGRLTRPEVMTAYPTFRNILFQVSGLKKEKELRGLLMWMVKYGKAPETIMEKVKFLIWVARGEDDWDGSADREQFAKILGVIADAVAKAEKEGKKMTGSGGSFENVIKVDGQLQNVDPGALEEAETRLTPEERRLYCEGRRYTQRPRICFQ